VSLRPNPVGANLLTDGCKREKIEEAIRCELSLAEAA
jgi:hypothetical protein